MKIEEYNKETMAKSVGRAMPISTRQAIEISNFIRGKNIQKMKTFLEDVIKKKRVVPFTIFNKGVGHKPGIGPGRYPEKSSAEILNLIKSAESNALFKGLNVTNLIINHVKANKAGNTWHYGRQRRRKMKRTHMDIILSEQSSAKEQNKENKPKKENKKDKEKND